MIDLKLFIPRTLNSISCNAKIKVYPDKQEISVCNCPIYRTVIVEERNKKIVSRMKKNDSDKSRSIAESVRRAQKQIRDIVACSGFTHFVTLTLNAQRIDRYSYEVIIKKLNNWLSNAVRRQGLSYVLIPEFHKDGAIHFHGLWKHNGDMKYVDSGHKTKSGQTVFNVTRWWFGFSNVVEIAGDYGKVTNYIVKYVTKDSRKVGGRWYLSGGGISRPSVFYDDIDYDTIDAKEYSVPNVPNRKFKYKTTS